MGFAHTSRKPLNRPILQFLDGTAIVNPRFFYKIFEGYGFGVSRRFEGVGSDAHVDLYFENPPGSGREVFIIIIEVVSFAQAYVDIYRGNTRSAAGTPLTPVNLNFGKDVSSVVSVEYGGSYTPGSLVSNTVCPGGSRIRATGGATEVGECMIIPPGFNFLVRVTNKSASSTDLSVRIIWWEEPTS